MSYIIADVAYVHYTNTAVTCMHWFICDKIILEGEYHIQTPRYPVCSVQAE